MRLKTNLIIGIIFAGLLGFVYFYEIKGGEERRAAAEKSKKLMDFSAAEARRLTIDRGDTVLVLEKEQDRWWLKSPVACEADQEAVERYLRNLGETERDRVVEDSAGVRGNPELGKKYQLHAPRLKVAVETAGRVKDTLWWGGDSPTQRFAYVQQRGANPEIFTVQAWRFDNLDKRAFDLRDRRVLAFEKEQVREIRLVQPGGRITLAKGEGWQLQSPVSAPADQQEVNDLLDRLHQAEVQGFVQEQPDSLAGYGLAPASVEVAVLLGDERAEKRLRVGGAAPGGTYYAQDQSRPPVFAVDSSLVKELRKGAFELRDKKPLKFARDQVDRIELQRPGQFLAATKDTSGTWTIVSPQEQPAKSWKFNSLLSQLEQVEVEEFVEGARDLRPYGLEAPRLKVILQAEGRQVLEARVGQKEEKYYLARGGETSIYRVGEGVLKDLDLKLEDVVQAPPADTTAAGG